MGSLNYTHSKSYRNRLSLFLQLSTSKKPSAGVSSESYFASTPTSLDWSQSTSSLLTPNPPFLTSNSRASSPLVPRSPMRTDTSFSDDPIPPTTNELDAREKAMLLRKARKLSRVFGEVPDLQRSGAYDARSSHDTPTHRRSTSTHSDVSSRKRARKSPSQSDLTGSYDSGSRMDESDRDNIPPVPLLALARRDSTDTTSSEPIPFQRKHRKNTSLNILTPLRSSDDGHTTNSSSSTSTTDILPNELPKHRKLRSLKEEGHANVLKTRKSYDSSLVNQAVKDKHLQRSRSLTPHKKKVLEESDNAVDFHRQYVQTFGRMNRRQDIPQVRSLPLGRALR